MRANISATVVAAIIVGLGACVSVHATETDDRVESSFKKTYVYTTYLKDDAIKVEAKNGLVTLTGAVSEESHKTLAQETAASLPGVTRVDNKLATIIGSKSKGSTPPRTPIRGLV